MTFPYFKSTLNNDEAKLASLILDNFKLKRDLIELDYGYLNSQDISEETEIEINILSIAFLCIHRPIFISDKRADLIEQTLLGVIVWMTKYYQKSTIKKGQLFYARKKLDTYKNELQKCISMEKGHLPLHIYSSLFHFPLQLKKVE